MAQPSNSAKVRGPAIDVGAQQVAAVYAKALLGASEKAGQTAAVLGELDALVDEVLDKQPALEAVFASQLVAAADKAGLVDRAFKPRLCQLTVDFLKVLARHGRLGLVRAIRREAHDQYDVLRGRVRVSVRTAAPLSDAQRERLSAQLRTLLVAEPVLEAAVQPDLIGGLVLRMGDTVYDGSVARQLAQLREQMIDRSVHEIQSRRDRFRLASGN